VDRAFTDFDKDGGWGYVIRDESGGVIQSRSRRVPSAINPMHMELIACIEGVKAAISLGVNNMIWRPMHTRWCGRFRVIISDSQWWVA
jgi:ribonuclease HI